MGCMEGFAGLGCEKTLCKDNCTAHGVCDTTNGTCICNRGFEGKNCEDDLEARCPKMCSDDLNQGHCTKEGCNCSVGFSGKDCATKVCPNDCTSPAHGSCSEDGVC